MKELVNLECLEKEYKQELFRYKEFKAFFEDYFIVQVELDKREEFREYGKLLLSQIKALKGYLDSLEKRIVFIKSNPEKFSF